MAKQAIAKAVARAASSGLRPALRAGQRRFGKRVVDGGNMLGKAEIFARDLGGKIGSIPGIKPAAVLGGVGGLGLLASGLFGGDSAPEEVEEETPWSLVDEEEGDIDFSSALGEMGPAANIGSMANNPAFKVKPQARPRPKPQASPMAAALSSAPPENGISSFAQGGVQAPNFGADDSELQALFKSIGETTSKDPYSMGLPPQQEQGGGGGDFLKSMGPLLAALFFGRMLK